MFYILPDINLDDFSEIERYPSLQQRIYRAHSRIGFIGRTTVSGYKFFSLPYGTTEVSDVIVYDDRPPSNISDGFAVQDDIIYLAGGLTTRWDFAYAEITSEDIIEFSNYLNIGQPSGVTSSIRDISIYRDTLYIVGSTAVYTLDIKKYRPVAKRTKTTIYPVFAEAGDTLDLTQFSPDAERFTFDVGFKKPPYLSINASNELGVGSGAETAFVKLKAINRIDATATDSFGFYLIIRRATAPVWRKRIGVNDACK